VLKKVVAAPNASLPAASQAPASSTPSKEICSRCLQGFFCSDHGIHFMLLPINFETVHSSCLAYFGSLGGGMFQKKKIIIYG
jgi:hypothetical protein